MPRALLLPALVLISAALQTLIFPVAAPLPFWRAQLAYIAFVPWILVLLQLARARRGVVRATLLSYLCGALWYLGTCYWIFGTMHEYGHLSPAMAALALVLFCLYLGLYHALFGFAAAFLMRHQPERRSWLMAPLLAVLWVAVELARARVTSFPWDLLGYSQIDNAALTHMAPLAGTYVISFVVLFCNALLATGVFAWRRAQGNAAKPLLAGGAVLAVLCLLLGGLLSSPKPAGDQAAILLQPNLSGDDDRDAGAARSGPPLPMESQFAQLTDSALLGQTTQPRARLVLWPEAPTTYELHEKHLQAVLTGIAKQHNVTVIADSNAVEAASDERRRYRLYNAAGLFTADGLHSRYNKIHLVPFGEFMPYESLFAFASGLTQQVGLFDRGTRRAPLSDGAHRYGVFICYESIFPDEVRQLARKGADVLINLSDDGWYGDTSAPFQHSNMARMRAIENRRWLLRDTNTGITESIDPYGNVRASAPRHQQLAVVMPYGYATELTFYTRYGDVFAWTCAAVAVLALLFRVAQQQAGQEGARDAR